MEQPTTFSTAIRRVLYLGQLFQASLEWLKMDRSTAPFMKTDIQNTLNSIKRFKEHGREVAERNSGSDANWQLIANDLNSERIQDLLLHFDVVSGIDNISQVSDEIQRLMVLQTEQNDKQL